MTFCNQRRIDRCQRAITSYSDDDERTNLVDFLADALHWSHAKGVSFSALLNTARMHFEFENGGVAHGLDHFGEG